MVRGRRDLVVVEGGCRCGRLRGVRWWELLKRRGRMGGQDLCCRRVGRVCRT